MFDILEEQIAAQIEQRTTVRVHFTDTAPERIWLYCQLRDGQERCFIEPYLKDAKPISKEVYSKLMNQCTDEMKEFDTDPEALISNMDFNSFFEKYYNNL